MIHATATYSGANRNLAGDIVISFTVDESVDIEALNAFGDDVLTLDVDKLRKKRSLDANAYFWRLCDLIAKAVGGDKDTVYLMMLQRYGVFETLEVIADAVPAIEALYRHVETVDTYTAERPDADGQYRPVNMAILNCYRGSHDYDTKEMSDLINGTVNDAEALGIPTLTEAELERIKGAWRAK